MSEKAARCLSGMFQRISIAINAGKDHLSELDGAIGDADHGITMSLGFMAVNAELTKLDHGITMSLGFMAVNAELTKLDLAQTLPSEIFAVAASAFLDAVGASTGPLYATGFRRVSQALKSDESLSLACQAMIVDEMRAGIQQRGKGQRGDKTMLDAWIPAAEAAIDANSRSLDAARMWKAILEAAETGAASTSSMVAARGRAARLGERSLGHIDPGAASAVIILRAMQDTFLEGGTGAHA